MTGACKFVGSGMLIESGGTQSGSLMTGGLQRPGRQDNCKAVALVRAAHTKGWWSLIQRPLTMLAAVLHLNCGVYLHMGAADPLFQSVQLLLRQVSTAAWHLWQLQEQNISRNERMLSLKAAGLWCCLRVKFASTPHPAVPNSTSRWCYSTRSDGTALALLCSALVLL